MITSEVPGAEVTGKTGRRSKQCDQDHRGLPVWECTIACMQHWLNKSG